MLLIDFDTVDANDFSTNIICFFKIAAAQCDSAWLRSVRINNQTLHLPENRDQARTMRNTLFESHRTKEIEQSVK